MRLLSLIFVFIFVQAKEPELFLLKKYHDDINVTSWYMSEKLDGVRAYWDGKKLISRSGKVFASPSFFTKDFPQHKLDGELWIKRDDFSNVASIVNKKKSHGRWREVTYNIFEVPNAKGNLLDRLQTVKENKFIKVIQQIKIKNKKHLYTFLKTIENKKGEGVVIRKGTLDYFTGRSKNAFKFKSYTDTECEVIGYSKGNGKYNGLIGALFCKMQDMKTVKIGSGLSNKQRRFPPKIGAIITFKYYGLTSKGNPRFPVFLRVRE